MNVNVVPIRRLPRQLSGFTYFLPKSFTYTKPKIGQWVLVPFRGKFIDGILWSLHSSTKKLPGSVLNIQSIVDAPIFTPEQRSMAIFLANRYFISLAHTLDVMLPDRPRRIQKTRSEQVFQGIPLPPVTLSQTRLLALQGVVRLLKKHRGFGMFFVTIGSIAERLSFLFLSLGSKVRGQHLVVVPTLAEMRRLVPHLQQRYGNQIVVFNSDLSLGQYWQSWQRVSRDRDLVILATKRGIFAPFQNLQSITLVQETDPSHKQDDQNPRYHTRTMLRQQAMLHRVPLYFLDVVPSLTLTQWSKLHVHSLAPLVPQRTVVDLLQERKRQNFEPLAEETQKVVVNRLPALFFLNRRGFSRLLHCQDCGWTYRCDQCQLPYIRHGIHEYRCHRCLRQKSPPASCPQCHGTRFKQTGIGTQQLEAWLKQQYPTQRIVRIDHDQPNADLASADFIVATEQILHTQSPPRFRCLIIVQLDALLQKPDFAVAEQALQLVERIIALSHPQAHVFIQTYEPDQIVAQALNHANYSTFYHEEIRLRETLKLPPSTTVIKLLGKDHQRDSIIRDAHELVDTLHQASRNQQDFLVEGPLLPWPEREGSWYRRTILLRLLPTTKIATVQHILSKLPTTWLIDTEPESLTQ